MLALHKQSGLALLMLVFLLALVAVGIFVNALDSSGVKNERDKKTTAALAEAKAALIGYAASRDLTSTSCVSNCARPGDLLCPDTDNDGDAEGSCGNAVGSTGQTNRLGRLPWKTLGLPDLRDGDGERLWYAVSNNYKNNTRFLPLNSDTTATITLRDGNGSIIFDGTNNGVVAVVIAPRAALVRQDLVLQVRNGATNQTNAENYLDIALGEDNQNFVDSNTNGFIMGPVKDASGNVILNDQIIAITSAEMNGAMESRVLAEVRGELNNYYAINSFYPAPADFNDANCLGNGDVPSCNEGALTLTRGRIPANPSTAWAGATRLGSLGDSNWFQQNAWREVIYYAVAPDCLPGTLNCTGGNKLTLNSPVNFPANNKEFILIATGSRVGVQDRSLIVNQGLEVNYLEDENLLPLDDVYMRTIPITTIINDRAITSP
ncbi:MAG: hypothetical protein ACKE5M_06605 [Methylophilaceae bacterium]